MTPVLVSVDKAGDLKLGAKKCRLYKKDEVVKVAKKYGINTEKKTVQQLCGAIKGKAKNSMNNVPLAKCTQAAKKRVREEARGKEGSRQEDCRQLYEEHDHQDSRSQTQATQPQPSRCCACQG
jgi:hypothetical protein